ncbi:MAG: formate dehydrogenase accessory sulfurtransferase FdhD [Polyangiales bacterium]
MAGRGQPEDAALTRGTVSRPTLCVQADGTREALPQQLVVEEPLEIRVAGEAMATTMRTPGADHHLALGFLFAEEVITSLADVGSVYHCGRTDARGYGNAIDVLPGPGVSLDVERLAEARRRALISSACGVCGRAEIDGLVARLSARRAPDVRVPAGLLRELPALLARDQALFARTGGLHAASALDLAGEVLAHAEDVGRHNAVDKVVGQLLHRGTTRCRAAVLAVSGRASFEIVQKAAVAGFACVASISAPSSLAAATAEATGITLASFVRDGRFTLYAHPQRVD